jgi:hypothetical protein
MNERTAQVLQNSASKLPMSPLAISRNSPTSARKSARSSANSTPVKSSGTPSKAPRTPMSLRKAVLTTPLRGLQLTGLVSYLMQLSNKLFKRQNGSNCLADEPPTPTTTRRKLKKDIMKMREDSDESDEDSYSESSDDDSNEDENTPVRF